MKTKLRFDSTTAELAGVRHAARVFLNDCGYGEDGIEIMVLAIDEACTNIIRHAYNNKCKTVKLTMWRLKDRVRIVLRDYGKKCDPGKIRSRALEDIRPGGLGVHIIQQAFDDVQYKRRIFGTKLVLEKKLSPAPAA